VVVVVVVVVSSPTSGRISDETTAAGDGGGGCKTRGIALSYRFAHESDEAPPIVCRRCRRTFFVSRSLTHPSPKTPHAHQEYSPLPAKKDAPGLSQSCEEEGRADDESWRTFFFTETAAASRYFGVPSFVRSSQSPS